MQTAFLKKVVHSLLSNLEMEGEAFHLLLFAPTVAVRKASEEVLALCERLDANAQTAQAVSQRASSALARTASGNAVAVAIQRLALLIELQFRGNRDVVAELFPETLQTVLTGITEAFGESVRNKLLDDGLSDEVLNPIVISKKVEARALAASAMLLILSQAVTEG